MKNHLPWATRLGNQIQIYPELQSANDQCGSSKLLSHADRPIGSRLMSWPRNRSSAPGTKCLGSWDPHVSSVPATGGKSFWAYFLTSSPPVVIKLVEGASPIIPIVEWLNPPFSLGSLHHIGFKVLPSCIFGLFKTPCLVFGLSSQTLHNSTENNHLGIPWMEQIPAVDGFILLPSGHLTMAI